MTLGTLQINGERLLGRLRELGQVGALPGGGVCRLALTDEDRAGRDLVMGWMRELGMEIRVDGIGNVTGTLSGEPGLEPVMTGSHIDTVRTGGIYDGNLGVLAGLEVAQVLRENRVALGRPFAVSFFTNEEGSRFAPDMMGSLVYQGDLQLGDALATVGIDGSTVGENLERIGHAGPAPCGGNRVHRFVELHIEQGPVLEAEGFTIGAVDSVQGISWTRWTFEGVSNHAGTTPMSMRRDAGLVAARLSAFVRELAGELGGNQLGTVGSLELSPNLVNVVPNRATLTVDLRSTDEQQLALAERRVEQFVEAACRGEGLSFSSQGLARFEPVAFDPGMVALVEGTARELGHSVRRITSGAGHDAQILARLCPTSMIFVPSAGGISHNVTEHTDPELIRAGAEVLLRVLTSLLET